MLNEVARQRAVYPRLTSHRRKLDHMNARRIFGLAALGFGMLVGAGTAALAQPRSGGSCWDAFVVVLPAALPYVDAHQYTCGRLNDYTGTCLGYYDGGEDIIYRLSTTEPVCVDVTVTGGDPNNIWFGVAVGADCPPEFSCLATGTSGAGRLAQIRALTLPAGTYYLIIDTWPAPYCLYDFTLVIETARGGCCLSEHSCVLYSADDCTQHGGAFLGAGTLCGVCASPGDMNCDGTVNYGDINPFVLALAGQAGYEARYPGCRWMSADCNGDGFVGYADINPFVNCLSHGGCP